MYLEIFVHGDVAGSNYYRVGICSSPEEERNSIEELRRCFLGDIYTQFKELNNSPYSRCYAPLYLAMQRHNQLKLHHP